MSDLGTKLLSHLSVALVIVILMILCYSIGKREGYDEAICEVVNGLIDAGHVPKVTGKLDCKER